MIMELASAYEVGFKVGLTGFKWIAKMIKDFPELQFIGGGEESFGYMVGDAVRDKDAVAATLLICELAAQAKANGSTVYKKLLQLYVEHGFYKEHLVLPIIFIYLGCNNYKKNINGGYISLTESLKVGISITFIAALVYATFSVIFNLIFPEFIDEMVAISRNAMIKQNPSVTEAELQMGLSMMKKFMNPYIVFPVTLAMYAFIGLIYSLIIGAILKKERPNAQF
jgi:hypothetical protein